MRKNRFPRLKQSQVTPGKLGQKPNRNTKSLNGLHAESVVLDTKDTDITTMNTLTTPYTKSKQPVRASSNFLTVQRRLRFSSNQFSNKLGNQKGDTPRFIRELLDEPQILNSNPISILRKSGQLDPPTGFKQRKNRNIFNNKPQTAQGNNKNSLSYSQFKERHQSRGRGPNHQPSTDFFPTSVKLNQSESSQTLQNSSIDRAGYKKKLSVIPKLRERFEEEWQRSNKFIQRKFAERYKRVKNKWKGVQ